MDSRYTPRALGANLPEGRNPLREERREATPTPCGDRVASPNADASGPHEPPRHGHRRDLVRERVLPKGVGVGAEAKALATNPIATLTAANRAARAEANVPPLAPATRTGESRDHAILVTYAEAARLLAVGIRAIRSDVQRGVLRAVGAGNRRRIVYASILEYIAPKPACRAAALVVAPGPSAEPVLSNLPKPRRAGPSRRVISRSVA